MTPLDAVITGLGALLMLGGIFLVFRPGPGGATVFMALGMEVEVAQGERLALVAIGAIGIALGTWTPAEPKPVPPPAWVPSPSELLRRMEAKCERKIEWRWDSLTAVAETGAPPSKLGTWQQLVLSYGCNDHRYGFPPGHGSPAGGMTGRVMMTPHGSFTDAKGRDCRRFTWIEPGRRELKRPLERVGCRSPDGSWVLLVAKSPSRPPGKASRPP